MEIRNVYFNPTRSPSRSKVHSHLIARLLARLKAILKGHNNSSHLAMAKSSEKVQIRGTCEPSYAPVRDKLEQMLRKGSEDNVQLCVYVDGKCVVDLAGTAKGNSSYNEESLQVHYKYPEN